MQPAALGEAEMKWFKIIALALIATGNISAPTIAQTRYRFSVAPQPVYRAPIMRPMPQSTPMIVQRQPVLVPYVQNQAAPYAQNRTVTYFQNYNPSISAAQKLTQQAAAAGFRVIGWDAAGDLLAVSPITGALVVWATPGVAQ